MNLPSSPVFSPDAFPDTDPKLLDVLNRAFLQLTNAVASIPEASTVADKSFTSSATGAATVDLKNPLAGRPSDVRVAKLVNDSGAVQAAAYGFGWVMAGDFIRLTFSALTASTKYALGVSVS